MNHKNQTIKYIINNKGHTRQRILNSYHHRRVNSHDSYLIEVNRGIHRLCNYLIIAV